MVHKLGSRRASSIALACGILVLQLSCWSTPKYAPLKRAEGLPSSLDELVDLSDRLAVEGAEHEDLLKALSALDVAERLVKDRSQKRMEVLWRKSRVLYLMADMNIPQYPKERCTDEGENAASEAATIAPDRVEGHYYYAIHLGLRAMDATVGALTMVPKVEAAAKKAVEIDPSYDDAGPLRLLGMLYVKAPSWPASIGDIDEGLKLLERATQISSFPLNRLFLGEALIEAGREPEGIQTLRAVLRVPRQGRWGIVGEKWREHARRLLRAVGQKD